MVIIFKEDGLNDFFTKLYLCDFHIMNSEKFEVPSNSIGHIKGKDKVNIRDIERRSGAKCNINGNSIVVYGSDEARRTSQYLINECINNVTSVYNHPLEAIIVLRAPLVGLNSVLFVKYQGIMDMNNMNKAFFVLDKGEEMK